MKMKTMIMKMMRMTTTTTTTMRTTTRRTKTKMMMMTTTTTTMMMTKTRMKTNSKNKREKRKKKKGKKVVDENAELVQLVFEKKDDGKPSKPERKFQFPLKKLVLDGALEQEFISAPDVKVHLRLALLDPKTLHLKVDEKRVLHEDNEQLTKKPETKTIYRVFLHDMHNVKVNEDATIEFQAVPVKSFKREYGQKKKKKLKRVAEKEEFPPAEDGFVTIRLHLSEDYNDDLLSSTRSEIKSHLKAQRFVAKLSKYARSTLIPVDALVDISAEEEPVKILGPNELKLLKKKERKAKKKVMREEVKAARRASVHKKKKVKTQKSQTIGGKNKEKYKPKNKGKF